MSRFDFIVSNPPYIASDHINTLADDVRLHDPMIALDGGVDGLEAYRRIFSNAKNLLYRSGRLYLEIGWNQAEQCTEIGRENGWRRIDAKRDFGGNMRLLVFAPPNLEQEETIYRRKGLESDNEHATFSVVQG